MMGEILVSINKKTNIVTIFYCGTKLVKNANDFKDMSEDEIKNTFIQELKIN